VSALTGAQLGLYRRQGHLTVPDVFRRWRRACALHYVRNATVFDHPALPYNHQLKLRIT